MSRARTIGAALLLAVLAVAPGTRALAQSAESELQARDATALPDPMPAVSPAGRLAEYETSPPSRNRYWIDPASISTRGAYVRLTLIAQSPHGARNVVFVAFDCSAQRHALLATADRDGRWRAVDELQWRPVSPSGGANTPYLRAVYRAVCDGGGPARTTALMVERLQHPRGGSNDY